MPTAREEKEGGYKALGIIILFLIFGTPTICWLENTLTQYLVYG